MNDRLNKVYGSLRSAIVPELQYSQYIYQNVLESTISSESLWLDIGCGHQLLPPWRLEQERSLVQRARSIVGVDYDREGLSKHKTISLRAQATADNIPFVDAYFDVATANMVVEHLDNPRVQFTEISRVLRPGGIFVFHTVNETGYFAQLRKFVPNFLVKRLVKFLDGRDSEDVFTVYYKANSEKNIRIAAETAGFEVERIQLISSDAVFAMFPPLAVLELIWIKLLMFRSLEKIRTNLIVTLKKKVGDVGVGKLPPLSTGG